MFYCSNFLAIPLIKLPNHNIKGLDGVTSEFLQWFSGFSDAESNFQISINDRNYVVFRFRIQLHIDDKDILDKIQNTLGIGVVRCEGDRAIFVVSDLKSITEVLLPIFEQFPLLTAKAMDLADFVQAINIRLNSVKPKLNAFASRQDKDKISCLKVGMNSSR